MTTSPNEYETPSSAQELKQLDLAATAGPWDFDMSDDEIEINAGTARTIWNGNVGTPARTWATSDRILGVEYDSMGEEDAEQVAANAEFITALVNSYRAGKLAWIKD